ncbi:MAG: DNA recombination protein RmuC [Alphaproteobacteria bacterium]|nr:DNA recombination protein RmuC [Alphaproteobacteria bacterium]
MDILVILSAFNLLLLIAVIVLMLCRKNNTEDMERLERTTREESQSLRLEILNTILGFSDSLRKTVEERLDKLREENSAKLEQMRATVDEKLQGTLEKRLGESFKIVSERLEKVHQGLGEMQNLASGVGDLKRVLTNVKLRGTWGEIQLGSLLEQMLTPEQYLKNVKTNPHSDALVEYAVKMPGGDEQVLIPLDAKFPVEDYERILAASEKGDTAILEEASRQLENSIKKAARDISEKYICPPQTTDFAIMFLPTEGLYAEVLRRPGLIYEIQQKYRVNVCGPTTLGALLNSLQMGFRTLAIQKRSGEVWKVLGEAKQEFAKYGAVMEELKKKLDQASQVVDKVGVRTRAIERRLKDVETVSLNNGEELKMIEDVNHD